MKELLLTPEGVRDIYGSEFAVRQELTGRLGEVFARFGYEGIQTPSFEFFDIFAKERGSVASREMYKFFDREGETLVLRPDMTPSIARCFSKYYREETVPTRLYYLANTFINNSSYQGRLKETMQAGAECIGDPSCAADAEMIALVIACLQSVGFSEFQVDVGEVNYFRGLIEEAGLDAETEGRLRELILAKNFLGVENLISGRGLTPCLSEAFLQLSQSFGGIDCVEQAKALTDNPTALLALQRLEKLYEILCLYGVEKYVTFDLGMLGKYRYYTGIIFQAFTYGTGEPLGGGGRYDGLMRQFGKEAPAVGCSLSVDNLFAAISRQEIAIQTRLLDILIVYEEDAFLPAVGCALKNRRQGLRCRLLKSEGQSRADWQDYARACQVQQLLYVTTSETEEVSL